MNIGIKNFEIPPPVTEIQYFEILATSRILGGERNYFFTLHVHFLVVILCLEGFLQWKYVFYHFRTKEFIFEVKIMTKQRFRWEIRVWKLFSHFSNAPILGSIWSICNQKNLATQNKMSAVIWKGSIYKWPTQTTCNLSKLFPSSTRYFKKAHRTNSGLVKILKVYFSADT